MHYLYLSIHNNAASLQQEHETLVAWCVENGVKDYDFIEDNLTIGRIPQYAAESQTYTFFERPILGMMT